MSRITQEQALALWKQAVDAAPAEAPILDAILQDICDAAIQHYIDRAALAQPEPVSSTPEELAAFLRFDETTGDDGSYDIEKPMMRRLAEIGLVYRKFASYYQTTEYGMSVLAAAKGGAL